MDQSLTGQVNNLEQLWNEWEIQVVVIFSLLLQILLLLTAGTRTRNYGMTWKPLLISSSLWLEYLLADYVATSALGFLSKSPKVSSDLLIFWAPFLLLHLGGQDTITALSIEDNELWKRHLLTFGSQVALAIYVFAKSLPPTSITLSAGFIFASGFLKYAERIWALKRASMSSLRSSMVTDPDPGPNYAKFMEEFYSSKAAGLHAKIEVVEERHGEATIDPITGHIVVNPKLDSREEVDNNDENHTKKDYGEIVCKAYEFFQTFKRLFVDLILSFENRKESQDYFLHLQANEAYKVIEVELYFMYDILHTKANVIHTWYGWLFRLTTFICTIAALVLFTISNKSAYRKIEVSISYLLLVGAVVLETFAVIFMLLSFWTYAALKKIDECNKLSNILFYLIKIMQPEEKSRWANSIAQYSLITYALENKSNLTGKTLKFFGVKDNWDNYWYTEYEPIKKELKELIFTQLTDKMKTIVDAASYRRISDHRGQWALQRKGYYKDLGWSVEAEFDESILLWHIATDLLFHKYEDNYSLRSVSQNISSYMLFLLIVRPFMLPAGIGQIRFGDTCAEAKNFLRRWTGRNHKEATEMILSVSTEYEPREVKGDRSKSVLFVGCKLAHQLEQLFKPKNSIPKEASKNLEKMWKLISVVWVEILCFAASKCGGNFHAKQLSMGGEFLTHVWFLMAHLGMGEQYRIEAGHARAKLIVEK
ncbi:hypothetical protein LUZ60_017732 [Juncus effusus]|nr:hypothetical protein LUZ60_017732 [Juncus effusus]